jgi:Spy/CpxP family protein refolding chaperone
MKSMHEEHLKRIRQGVSNRNVQITAVLTPGQQKQFEEIERERQEMWRQKRAKYGGRESGYGGRESGVTDPLTNSHQRKNE